MRRRPIILLLGLGLTLGVMTPLHGQVCLGRPLVAGQKRVGITYEPQVKGWTGVLGWHFAGLWSFHLQGGTLGELVSPEELDTLQEWTRIGSTLEVGPEGEREYPIITRRASEEHFGASALLETSFLHLSLCMAAGLEVVTGGAELNERITYLDALGPRWVRSEQDYSGVRAPVSVAMAYEGVALGQAALLPFVSVTYWVDRVTFDRVSDGFTYEGWYGAGGATVVLQGYSAVVGFRTADDLRDESLFLALGYTF